MGACEMGNPLNFLKLRQGVFQPGGMTLLALTRMCDDLSCRLILTHLGPWDDTYIWDALI